MNPEGFAVSGVIAFPVSPVTLAGFTLTGFQFAEVLMTTNRPVRRYSVTGRGSAADAAAGRGAASQDANGFGG